jgi:hypothetical protein
MHSTRVAIAVLALTVAVAAPSAQTRTGEIEASRARTQKEANLTPSAEHSRVGAHASGDEESHEGDGGRCGRRRFVRAQTSGASKLCERKSQ